MAEKLEAAKKWVTEHPDAKDKDAVAAGITKSTFYMARMRLKKESVAVHKPRAHANGVDPVAQLFQRMEQELGVVEAYYRHGELEILQRRRIKVR